MTSICIQSREAGVVSACAVLEPEDLHVALTLARPDVNGFGSLTRLTLTPEEVRELGEALVRMSQELRAQR